MTIHPWDTHYWLGYTRNGWLSQDDLQTTADERFSQVEKLWIVPLSGLSFQTSLRVEKPEGHTLFFRHRPHQIVGGPVIGVEYILAVEKGSWTPKEAAALNIDELPLKNGFRAKLDLEGNVHCESAFWTYTHSSEDEIDIYNFIPMREA
jgi:hypothetical protein